MSDDEQVADQIELWRCERCEFACPIEHVDIDANGFDCVWCERNALAEQVAQAELRSDIIRVRLTAARDQREAARSALADAQAKIARLESALVKLIQQVRPRRPRPPSTTTATYSDKE